MAVEWYIYFSLALFVLGIMGVLTRRNAIIILMSIQLMLLAVIVLLTAFSKTHLVNPTSVSGIEGTGGQLFALLILIVSLGQLAIGLAIIVRFFRNTRSVDVSFLNRLKN